MVKGKEQVNAITPIALRVNVVSKGKSILEADVPITDEKLARLVKALERSKAWYAAGADLSREAVRTDKELFDDFDIGGATVEFRIYHDGGMGAEHPRFKRRAKQAVG